MTELSSVEYLHLQQIITDGDKDVMLQFLETKCISKETFLKSQFSCESPIHFAAYYGRVEILNCLIGIGLDFQLPLEQCLLHVAAKQGHLSVIKSLIENHGYDVDEQNATLNTPVFSAVEGGNLDVVKYLVESGADINHMPFDSSTLLHHAVSYQQTDICEYILSRDFRHINYRDSSGNTALYLASLFGEARLIDLLLVNGADVCLANNQNMTPFWAATYRGNLELLKYLYSRGADPEGASDSRAAPIFVAARGPHVDVVHYLAVVLNVSLTDTSIDTDPLTVALRNENWEIVMLLLEAGCEIKGDHQILLSKFLGRCSDGDTVANFIKEHLRKPRKLVDMCCFTIRRVLGRNVSVTADLLPLPCKLISFIKLTHVLSD